MTEVQKTLNETEMLKEKVQFLLKVCDNKPDAGELTRIYEAISLMVSKEHILEIQNQLN